MEKLSAKIKYVAYIISKNKMFKLCYLPGALCCQTENQDYVKRYCYNMQSIRKTFKHNNNI